MKSDGERFKRTETGDCQQPPNGLGYLPGKLSWDYIEKVNDFLKPDTALLDMGTNGETVYFIRHPRELISAVAADEPSRQRLSGLGVDARVRSEGGALPFPDGSFDLAVCFQCPYDVGEVKRVLKAGGFFITQQTGGQESRRLLARILPGVDIPGKKNNLENRVPEFKDAGFKVMYRNQAYPTGKFLSPAALMECLRRMEDLIPGFSAEDHAGAADRLWNDAESGGFVENQEHRYIIVAKK